jgi:hypothetical protein
MLTVVLSLMTLAIGVVSLILALGGRHRDLLLLFVLGSIFVRVIHGFFNAAGYLGVGKEWSFLDLMFLCLLVIVWPTARRPPYEPGRGWLSVPLVGLSILAVIAFVVGMSRSDSLGALHASRRLLCLPVFFIALRVFTTPESITGFYRGIKWCMPVLLAAHVIVAFQIYLPPLPQEIEERVLSTWGEFLRVEFYMAPLAYVVGAAIALCELLYRRGHVLFNATILTVCCLGVLLSQTRSYYLALAVIVAAALILIRGRLMLVIWGSLATAAIFGVVQYAEVDLFYRFKGSESTIETSLQSYWSDWRGQEYSILAEQYAAEPQYLLTGRGMGARHPVPHEVKTANYWHNEYLMTLDQVGLIGLACHLVLVVAAVFVNRHIMKDPLVGHLFAPARLVFIASLPASVFIGYVWGIGTGAMTMCLLAIIANGKTIAASANEEAYLHSVPRLAEEAYGPQRMPTAAY